ncbi:MAG TPA: protein kinase [Thermoanaerobaculia bacterium]|nr:protein kinase [Thermoanaerobaculia bacterium]
MTVSMLPSGTVLGHYRLGGVIGRGGMGEVYIAYDELLERRVAIKVLAPELLDRPDRVRRFIREAKSASALDHPHILTVHEIGEGQLHGAPVHYIAMELVEGPTLREIIHDQRPPLTRLLEILIQVTDALAKAHETGLVHRDLKPDNIMVTADGYAKVIDFGLAKLAEPHLIQTADTKADTLSRESGLLGTLGYMSPEQVEQKSVDNRADIFSFGCVLYEAVTRSRAFTGDSRVDVLHKILHEPPPPMGDSHPAEVRRLIDRCLEKSPMDRYQSMRDVALELRAIRQQLSGGSQPGSRPLGVASRSWLAIAAALVVAAVAVLLVLQRHARNDRTPMLEALARWPSNESDCRFSPDGAWLSFLSDRGGKSAIWLRRMKGGEPAMLIDRPANIRSHVWSPDSSQIACLSVGPDKVFLQFVPAFGGPPRESLTIDDQFRNGRLIRWIGRSIYLEGRNGLSRFDALTHTLSNLVPAMAKEGRRVDFDIRRDEKRVTYSIHQDDREVVWVASVDGSDSVRVTPVGAHYSDYRSYFGGADLDELVLSSDRSGQIDVWRMSLGKQSAQQITSSPGVEWVTDVAPNGESIVLMEERNYSNLWLWDGSSAEPRQITAEAVQDQWPSASSETPLVAFQRSKATNETVPYIFNSNIFAANLSNGQFGEARLAVSDGALPHLSPTGRWLTYVRPQRPTEYELWLKDLRSEHQWRVTSRFRPSPFYRFPNDWVESALAWATKADLVYFVERSGADRQEIGRATPPAPDSVPVVRGETGVNLHDLRVSADDRFLAYVRTSTRSPWRSEVVVHDLATGRGPIVFSRIHGRYDKTSCKGWRKSGQLVVLQSTYDSEQHNERIQVLQIDSSGKESATSFEPHAFGGTARIDPSSDSIILTAVDSRGFHNLELISLVDGHKRWLTNNRLPGISFGGLEIGPEHRLLFCRQESNSDLWLINFSR